MRRSATPWQTTLSHEMRRSATPAMATSHCTMRVREKEEEEAARGEESNTFAYSRTELWEGTCVHFTHGDTHWVGGAQVRVLFRSRCSSYLGTAVATNGKAAALCTTSMALLHSCRPSECDDVISRAHVSRNREQQATTALRGHRWVAPPPPFFPSYGWDETTHQGPRADSRREGCGDRVVRLAAL